MKNFLLLILLFPLCSYAQEVRIGLFGGAYNSNRETLNQENDGTVGIELAHLFSEKSRIMMRINRGRSDYFEDSYNNFLDIETPATGTNTSTTDYNLNLLFGRDFGLSEKIKLNSALGLSLILFDFDSFQSLSVTNQNGSSIRFPLEKDAGFGLGFPLIVGGEFMATSRWSFHIEGSTTVEPGYGLISNYAGSKISLRISPD